MNLERMTDATVEPWTTAEAKAHLRVTTSDHDTYIAALVKAARQHVETYTGRAMMEQTWKLRLDRAWPGSIVLPRPPLLTVASIAYVDLDGATQTLAANQYQVDAARHLPVITPAYGVTWPDLRDQLSAVTITYTAGYHASDTSKIPSALRHAMLLLVGSWFMNREAVVIGTISSDLPHGVEALLFPFRIFYEV